VDDAHTFANSLNAIVAAFHNRDAAAARPFHSRNRLRLQSQCLRGSMPGFTKLPKNWC
jgi:hypothetical protein